MSIRVIKARSNKDMNLPAIHVLKPSKDILEDAKDTAKQQGLKLVIIHNDKTWSQAYGR